MNTAIQSFLNLAHESPTQAVAFFITAWIGGGLLALAILHILFPKFPAPWPDRFWPLDNDDETAALKRRNAYFKKKSK